MRITGMILVTVLVISCTEDIENRYGEIYLTFRGNPGERAINIDDGILSLNQAYLVVGEIGIHWGRLGAQFAPMHDDPGGKPTPKIYEYFAIDLLSDDQNLQVFSAVHTAAKRCVKTYAIIRPYCSSPAQGFGHRTFALPFRSVAYQSSPR